MKRFVCHCVDEQFKHADKILVGQPWNHDITQAAIQVVYFPNGKVCFRNANLDVNFCPKCGMALEDIQEQDKDKSN